MVSDSPSMDTVFTEVLEYWQDRDTLPTVSIVRLMSVRLDGSGSPEAIAAFIQTKRSEIEAAASNLASRLLFSSLASTRECLNRTDLGFITHGDLTAILMSRALPS